MLRKAGQEEGAINIEAAYVTSFFFFLSCWSSGQTRISRFSEGVRISHISSLVSDYSPLTEKTLSAIKLCVLQFLLQ